MLILKFDKIKKKKKKKKTQNKTQKKTHKNCWLNFCLNKECPKLLCGLGGDSLCGIVRGGGRVFRASLYVWCLRYSALCDDLVVFKLWAIWKYSCGLRPLDRQRAIRLRRSNRQRAIRLHRSNRNVLFIT